MRTILLIGAAALALAGCNVTKQEAANADANTVVTGTPANLTQADAEKIVADAEAAWSSGRIETVMANYADGAVVFDTTNLAPTTDRNIQTRGNASFLTMKPADFRVDPRHVQLLDNDTIVASGVLSFTANVGAARPVLKARYTQVYQRQPDGSFKIVHEHMSSPPRDGNAVSEQMSGGCACERIRFEAEVASFDAYLCHCRMCQRASGNVSLAMIGVEQAAVRWATEPDWYRSSPIAKRPFCATCGTSLGFRYDRDTTKMDLTVASFDDPSRFRPTSHFGAESIHEDWLDTSTLPRMRSEQYDQLVERWKASGEAPR